MKRNHRRALTVALAVAVVVASAAALVVARRLPEAVIPLLAVSAAAGVGLLILLLTQKSPPQEEKKEAPPPPPEEKRAKPPAPDKPSPPKAEGELPFAVRLMDYVLDHYEEDISLSDLAGAFGMSEPYISTRFKKEVGVSFVQYVSRLRVDKVKEMLVSDPDMKIADIAERLHMTNAQNLIRVFKKYEGITPGQYREQHRHEAAE